MEYDEELLEYEVTDPIVLSVYEDTNIKELLKTVKDMLRVDKAYGREISRQKEILNKIVKFENARDKEKAKEAINKKLDKVYKSIISINSYLEVYPIYIGIKNFIL